MEQKRDRWDMLEERQRELYKEQEEMLKRMAELIEANSLKEAN